MNKRFLYSLFVATLALSGCDYNEEHFPGYDELAHPTDVKSDTITLASTDYSTIAGLKANQSIALAKDPEGKYYVNALNAVGTNRYFTEDAPALWYLPAFLDEEYPYLDNDSKVTIHYNNYADLPEYLKDFNRISDYELGMSDYQVAWGEGSSVPYLSPSTVSQIPNILGTAIENPANGEMRMVSYAYSETEPGSGGGEVVTYTSIADILATGVGEYNARGEVIATYGRGFLLNDGTASILVYLGTTANYSVGDVVTISGEVSEFGGLFQFPNSSEVTFVERSESFSYPSAEAMDVADINAWVENKEVKYASITGQLDISGNYYNIILDGTDRQGSISYAQPGLVDPALDGQQVTVTGYMIGTSSSDRYVNFMATSVVAAGTTSEYTPIGVIALSENGKYAAKGVVVALYNRGFLLNDGTGSILVYLNQTPTVQINDIVTVSGSTTAYAGLQQFGNSTEVTVISSGASYNRPASWAMTGADMDAYLETPHVAYVVYEGTLTIDGYYYNVAVEGAETAVGSLSYPLDGQIDPSLNGKNIIVTGYTIGTSGSRYVNTMTIEVVEASAANKARIYAQARAAAGAPEPNRTALYRYNGESWSTYRADGVDITVMQPSDYEQMGRDYVSNRNNILPTYLRQTYPYAYAEDVATVVYYADSEGTIAATEYIYDGTTWNETTVATPATITFQKVSGEWTEARVYLESSLLNGDTGGFTTQDIELSGLDYVWTLDNAYGWKGSGFSNTNHKTESWLVSPEIDLSNAASPVLTFDIAINYLRGNNRADYINVMIATNYTGDATTADWETLEITGWPEGMSWTFYSIDPYSLSRFVGQKIRLAFHYKSSEKAAPTVEVQNISIKE